MFKNINDYKQIDTKFSPKGVIQTEPFVYSTELNLEFGFLIISVLTSLTMPRYVGSISKRAYAFSLVIYEV